MRILHTSDWHLGVSQDQSPREKEHELFLDWLIQELIERDIDVLVHGGDTFHYVQPSSRCLKMYYDFLARCARETTLRQIVITAGNHDSASRIDAPGPVLEQLNVHVVGTLSHNESTWDRALCPIMSPDGHVESVIVAVPYIHESRLGVTATGRTPRQIRNELVEKFSSLYLGLTEHAMRTYPEVPRIATGHLTCYPDGRGAVEGDYATPLHLVELGSLPPTVFGLGYSYVALGHIHRMFDIPGPNAWYAGSPVPTDIIEARTARYVLQVEVDPEFPDRQAHVEKIEVPCWRPIFELTGEPDKIIEELGALEWQQELFPYIYVDMHVDQPLHNGVRAVEERLDAFDSGQRPRIIKYKETIVRPDDAAVTPAYNDIPLQDLNPADVFEQMYRLKYEISPDERVMTAFHSLLREDHD